VATACGSCTAPVTDAYLCAGCTRDLAEQLLLAASIAADLDDAIAKLLKRGSGGPRSEAEAPLPIDLAASDAKADLQHRLDFWSLRTWRRSVMRAEYPPGGIVPRARWLAAYLAAARQDPYAGRLLGDVRDAVSRALAVIDRQPERAPAGTCDGCGKQLLAELGADEVTCGCGALTIALQDKRRERAAAADVLGTAGEIHGALKRIGIDIPRGTITSWATRKKLLPRPGGMYALSDVLALHAQSQARR
jgi:hypothetical protein